ncbi:hypothetical protein J0A67_02005 [Algoriphagus aestuariicola]|jgi:hypothetical protein|uniref:Outer membrane protein beta-barrel domain-containing protein n=1 Tax=Algoriphagus aestuariicola TaxID=1852016 RepID=A0ABS3BKT2_9BACT|nr:hypothetical protein [Algoriphagus aestuariicola]MBN7799612.1 hypothetical protein [Algoriphagus aestuariicola]
MKTGVLLVFLLLCGVSVFAQSGLEVRGYFGVSSTLLGPKAGVVGAGSSEMDGFREFGVMLSKGIGRKFRVNGGLSYSYGKVEFQCDLCNLPDLPYPYNQDFRMLSIPLYAEYELTKFLFVAGGPLLDFQHSESNNFDDQSGVGYLVGLGGKVRAEKFTFSLFPNYKRHGVIPFENNGEAKDILQELGVQAGVGYRF